MQTISVNRTGLVFGLVLGGWHAVWAMLVGAGWAQPLMDFVFWIHMIKPVWVIQPFSAWLAMMLVAVTGALGYLTGVIAAAMWNWLRKEPQRAARPESAWVQSGPSSAR